jgi:hypothetical protein
MKLNGWQRLWVVLSGFYLIAIISFAAIDFPQISHIRHSEGFNIGFQEIRPSNFLKNWDDEISKPEFQKLDSDQQQWKFVQFLDVNRPGFSRHS